MRTCLWWSLCTLCLRACQVSYRRRLRSLLLYLCYVFRALIKSLVCRFNCVWLSYSLLYMDLNRGLPLNSIWLQDQQRRELMSARKTSHINTTTKTSVACGNSHLAHASKYNGHKLHQRYILIPSLISLVVSVDVKHHVYLHPHSVPNKPCGFCGR